MSAAFDSVKVNPSIEAFKKSISKTAHEIVTEQMPKKIIHLDKLLGEMPPLKTSVKEVSRAQIIPSGSKKRKLEDGSDDTVVPSNKSISDSLLLVKEELLDMITLVNTVKIWIQLNIPRIEDGNDFGVGIQEEMVSELGRAESDSLAVLESMTKYYITRGKLVSKFLKYPGVEDYRQSLVELDEKEFINLRLCILDIRNNFAILYDMILKNIEKIKRPRPSNHVNTLY